MPSISPLTNGEKAIQNDNENGNEVLDTGIQVERKITGGLWFIVNTAVLSATFLYALDNTIMANVRPNIIETFGNQVEILPWLSISYPMGEVGANPLWFVVSCFALRPLFQICDTDPLQGKTL